MTHLQMWVQGEINLHNPRKIMISASWSQNDVHGQATSVELSQDSPQLRLERSHHFPSYIIFYDWQHGLHQSGTHYWDSKIKVFKILDFVLRVFAI
jgi:hypothetical protein